MRDLFEEEAVAAKHLAMSGNGKGWRGNNTLPLHPSLAILNFSGQYVYSEFISIIFKAKIEENETYKR